MCMLRLVVLLVVLAHSTHGYLVGRTQEKKFDKMVMSTSTDVSDGFDVANTFKVQQCKFCFKPDLTPLKSDAVRGSGKGKKVSVKIRKVSRKMSKRVQRSVNLWKKLWRKFRAKRKRLSKADAKKFANFLSFSRAVELCTFGAMNPEVIQSGLTESAVRNEIDRGSRKRRRGRRRGRRRRRNRTTRSRRRRSRKRRGRGSRRRRSSSLLEVGQDVLQCSKYISKKILTSFRLREIQVMVHLSQYAYDYATKRKLKLKWTDLVENTSHFRKEARFKGEYRVAFYHHNGDNGAAIVFYHYEGKGKVVVAFRGTFSKADAATDADFEQSDYEIKDSSGKVRFSAKVHTGFYKAFKRSQWVKGLRKALSKLRANNQKSPRIIVTGHSMGGALAHLAAVEIHARFRTYPSVYTFASPRVGNAKFARIVMSTSTHYRVLYRNDPVPDVPPSLFGDVYRHGSRLALRLDTKIVRERNHRDGEYKRKPRSKISCVAGVGSIVYKLLVNPGFNILSHMLSQSYIPTLSRINPYRISDYLDE